MPLIVDGKRYLYVDEVLKELGISRATLWRWRADEKIPPGSLHRNRVVFSAAEVQEIKRFVGRIVPLENGPSGLAPTHP